MSAHLLGHMRRAVGLPQASTPIDTPHGDGRFGYGPTGMPTGRWRVMWRGGIRPGGGKEIRPLVSQGRALASEGHRQNLDLSTTCWS